MIQYLDPTALRAPHKITRIEQVRELYNVFKRDGWGENHPALVGYKMGNRIQLLSGTHRQAAAIAAGLKLIPVVLFKEDDIRMAYGNLEAWNKIMTAGDRSES